MVKLWHRLNSWWKCNRKENAQWKHWKRHLAKTKVPSHSEPTVTLSIECPHCHEKYNPHTLGIPEHTKQGTVHCHCGAILELIPHSLVGWKSVAVVERGHTRPDALTQ